MKLDFSFVIPVFNRPQEIKELLDSFLLLDYNSPFEIVIVEDGSSITSEDVVNSFRDRLNIAYYYKKNTGPGDSRNFGMQKAKGDYYIILDSDVLLPEHYLRTVAAYLSASFFHCFGGADAAHPDFTPLQKAINYVMTSFLTTGGIRGRNSNLSHFEPRSFNMGISRQAFLATGGFAKIHPGEDPDLSHRIKNAGFETTFIPNAFVYHKRRISWRKFYTQVRKFGLVRPILNSWHPNSRRITFWFPSVFLAFVLVSVICSLIVHWAILLPLLVYLLAIFVDSGIKNKSISIALMSVFAVFVQFLGYGSGFLKSTLLVRWLNKDPEKQFPNLFFK